MIGEELRERPGRLPEQRTQGRRHLAVRAGIRRRDMRQVERAPGRKPGCQEPLLVRARLDGLVLHAAAGDGGDRRRDLQSRGDQVPGRLPSDLARRPGDEDRRYASAAFLGSLLPPSELFFSDFSDDLPSLELSDLPSEPVFFRLP